MTSATEKRTQDERDLSQKANIILVDIEGTTTSIDFVKKTLFPYVRKNLESYLKAKWNEEEFKGDLKLLREQAKQDEADKLEGLVQIPDGDADDIIEEVKKNVLWQMDLDRKTTALKNLQGHIWRDAYTKGDIKAHVYADVVPALKSWHNSGKEIYVYSSGSVEAQKLLFGHTEEGNLLELFSGYFDTSVGPKVEASSYSNIVNSLKCKKEEIVFFTDVPKEAKAAREAGLQSVVVVREGNVPITDEEKADFTIINSFEDFIFEASAKRRKKVGAEIEKAPEMKSEDTEMEQESSTASLKVPEDTKDKDK